MADPVISCVDPNISLSQLMNSVRVKKISTGEQGLRAVFLTASAADLIGIECSEVMLSETQILRMAFGLTATGKTAIVFITET